MTSAYEKVQTSKTLHMQGREDADQEGKNFESYVFGHVAKFLFARMRPKLPANSDSISQMQGTPGAKCERATFTKRWVLLSPLENGASTRLISLPEIKVYKMLSLTRPLIVWMV